MVITRSDRSRNDGTQNNSSTDATISAAIGVVLTAIDTEQAALQERLDRLTAFRASLAGFSGAGTSTDQPASTEAPEATVASKRGRSRATSNNKLFRRECLLYLVFAGKDNATSIARHCGVSPSSGTYRMQVLRGEGLVHQSRQDLTWSLTPKGKTTAARYEAAATA
jgi:hypothetical protein